MTKYQLLTVNDKEDTCQKCGKTNLKKVAWIIEVDEDNNHIGDPMAYGVDCAAYALMGDKKASTKKAIEYQGKVIELAKGYLAKGFTPRQVADWIGGRGFRVSLKDNRIELDFTTINL